MKPFNMLPLVPRLQHPIPSNQILEAAFLWSISRSNPRVRYASTYAGQPIPPIKPLAPKSRPASDNALSRLSTSSVLRSYAIMAVSSSPIMLSTSTTIMRKMLASKSAIWDIGRNPVLKWLFKSTVYDQFCAGEREAEVRQTVESMRKMGFTGCILEYGAEVLEDEASMTPESIAKGIETWKVGLLDTIKMSEPGDFVGLKWSGMGPQTLRLMKANKPPSKEMHDAMVAICDAAAAKKVRLLPAAEPQNANRAVDAWTVQLAEHYNKIESGNALIYCTFQSYLKSNARNLAQHLKLAHEKQFTLGVKLVRGAYLHSETRNLIWDTKTETDFSYNEIATALISRDVTRLSALADDPNLTSLPLINLVVASHNLESVEKAQSVWSEQNPATRGEAKVVFAQLQGMADEVSCQLISEDQAKQTAKLDRPAVYKCVTWGSIPDCMNYLLRRAEENQDALSRTVDTRKAMGKELWRRVRAMFSLA